MKIAIVGNGKLSKNYGADIDSHDVVVRFNHAQIKGYEKLIGTKINILALAGATKQSWQNEFRKIDRDILRTCECICFSGNKHNYDYENALLSFNSDLKISYVERKFFKTFCLSITNKKYKMIPSTGMNVLVNMIFKKPDNYFDIYGFDCFESGHYSDDEIRNNHEFHDLKLEKKIICYLSEFENINFYN